MDSEFSNIPNWHGLQASDFDFDMDSDSVALRFLGDVSVGTLEEDALRIEGGTPDTRRSWESSRRFRRALGKCREMGGETREYDAQRAARRSDPFATPPRPGAPDLAAETYDPQNPPRSGLARWLRRLGVLAGRQAQSEPATTSGQHFTALADLTPEQAQAIGRQRDAEAQRVRAERAPEGQQGIVPGVQQWDGKGISPDGTQVGQ